MEFKKEVYYKNGKIYGWSDAIGATPYGNTLTELKDSYLIMQNAFSKPVLRVTGKKLVEIKKK